MVLSLLLHISYLASVRLFQSQTFFRSTTDWQCGLLRIHHRLEKVTELLLLLRAQNTLGTLHDLSGVSAALIVAVVR